MTIGAPAWPDAVANYLRVERCLTLVDAAAFDLSYDAEADAIRIPVDGRVKFHRGPRAGGAKTWWEPLGDADVAAGEALPPFPSWRDLRDAELIVEGEFDAMVAIAHGFAAASGTAGAGTFLREWVDAMTGRSVTILYDNDDAGRRGARVAAERLMRGGCLVRIASWPADLPDGWDITDHFRTGGSAEELAEIIERATPFELEDHPPTSSTAEAAPRIASIATLTWSALEDLAASDPPAQLVDGHFAEGERVLVFGFTSHGKSSWARELALAVHRGEPFLGEFATEKRRVGYADEESPERRLGQALAELARVHGIDSRTDGELPVFAVRQGIRLDTPKGIAAAADWIRANELGVVVVDTLIRVHRLRENDAEDMARIDEATRELQASVARPLTIVLVHHSPKPRENGSNDPVTMARGSGDILGSVDVGLYLRRGREKGQIVVERAKTRWTEDLEPYLVRREGVRLVHAGGIDQLAGLLDRALEVIAVALREGPRSRPELLERGKAAKIPARTIDRALGKAVDDGLAIRGRDGRRAVYTLTEGGLLLP